MHGVIRGRRIGERERLFVVAELGLNHGGSVERALAMVDAAAEAGAAAVKLQSFTADELVAAECPAPAHVPAASLRDFFRTFELDEAAHIAVRDRARTHGLAFVSTPFSCRAVDMLERIGTDALKIASGDLTYDALIARAARTGLPIIMSTGMSSLAETAHAVATARLHGVGHIALLHCVSSYPTPQDSQNLRVIQTLARVFDVPVGLSDHAADTSAVPVAVTLGASIYERHLMLPGDHGVDAAVSSTPDAFKALIALAARTQSSLGHGRRECLPAEAMNVTASRRSLHAVRALQSGDVITAADVTALRPSSGLPAPLLDELIGARVTRAIEAGERFRESDLPAEDTVKSLNVLVTAASRRVPLVQAFQKALQDAGIRGKVIATDVNSLSPAVHVTDRWYHVPLATAPDYLDAIAGICDAENIGLVVPTIDDELEIFGGAAQWFARHGVRVAVSPESTSRICNDKLATCAHLRGAGVRAAETWLPGEVPSSPRFPLFIKPRFGRGGVGAHAVHARKDLTFFSDYVETPVVQEYLDGPEFTIDLFCDFAHRPLAVVPRERVVVRAGVMDRGRTVKDRALIALAEQVAEVLPFLGAANIQCRVVKGEPVIFEINPRFSGGIPLTIAAGADFPRFLVDLATGRSVPPRIGKFRDQLWMTCYEAAIFVDAVDLATGRKVPAAIGEVA